MTELTSGFDTPESLIGYCEIHCETPRALFSGKQINDMIMLAGYPEDYPSSIPEESWQSAHEDMAELCKLAREKLK